MRANSDAWRGNCRLPSGAACLKSRAPIGSCRDRYLDLLARKQGHISKTFFMEDAFFGYWGSIDPHFHACPPLVAAKFSLEMEPDYWMKKTASLPMGIHGFEIWHKDFYNSLLQESFQNLYEAYPQLENL